MKLLLGESDIQFATELAFALQNSGFFVSHVQDGQQVIRKWTQETPDVVVMNTYLPLLSGFDVVRRIRAVDAVPILMTTGKSTEEDMVRGLDLGADDYLVQPFGAHQLLARIRAITRRLARKVEKPLRSGALTLDVSRRELQIQGQGTVYLTQMEYRLMRAMLAAPDRVVATDDLISQVWGCRQTDDTAMLRQIMRRLRQKIEPDPISPIYIETILGVGYMLNSYSNYSD
jgi:two-component system response regulator RegX3